MITIEVTPETKQVLINVDKLEGRTKKGLRKALKETGQEVKREIRRLIKTGPKTGRSYGTHQASAPGEAPANRSGRLAKSVNYKVRNWKKMIVGEKASYAGYLEDGTKNEDGTYKIKPRPHIIKAVNNKEQDTENAILRNVKKETNT